MAHLFCCEGCAGFRVLGFQVDGLGFSVCLCVSRGEICVQCCEQRADVATAMLLLQHCCNAAAATLLQKLLLLALSHCRCLQTPAEARDQPLANPALAVPCQQAT
jgi:hypothetical protein